MLSCLVAERKAVTTLFTMHRAASSFNNIGAKVRVQLVSMQESAHLLMLSNESTCQLHMLNLGVSVLRFCCCRGVPCCQPLLVHSLLPAVACCVLMWKVASRFSQSPLHTP